MIAWTFVYNPFVMGGNVWQPKGFKFDRKEKKDLGKGFYGYQLFSPKGKEVIVEQKSGAIVGNSLEEVRKDILSSTIEIMQKQVEDACKQLCLVKIISENKFWDIYEK